MYTLFGFTFNKNNANELFNILGISKFDREKSLSDIKKYQITIDTLYENGKLKKDTLIKILTFFLNSNILNANIFIESLINNIWDNHTYTKNFYHPDAFSFKHEVNEEFKKLQLFDEIVPISKIFPTLAINHNSYKCKLENIDNYLLNTAKVIKEYTKTEKIIINDIEPEMIFDSLLVYKIDIEKIKKGEKVLSSNRESKLNLFIKKIRKANMDYFVNEKDSKLYDELLYPLINVYTLKTELLKIYNEIEEILDCLKYTESKKNEYYLAEHGHELSEKLKFRNTFPKRKINIYIIILFSVLYKSEYENMRKLVITLFGGESNSNLGKIKEIELEKYLKKFKKLHKD